MVGVNDGAFLVDHHEPVGQPFDQRSNRWLRRAFRDCSDAGGELELENAVAFDSLGSADQPGPTARAEMDEDSGRLPMLGKALQHGLKGLAFAWHQPPQQLAAAHGRAQRAPGSGVGLDDLEVLGPDVEDNLAGRSGWEVVGRLKLASLPVVALQRLLRLDQPGFHPCHGQEVPADHEQPVHTAQADRRVLDGQLAAAREALRDLPESGHAAVQGILDHPLHALAAHGDGVGPRAAEPSLHAFPLDGFRQRSPSDHAFHVEMQRDVRLCEADGGHRLRFHNGTSLHPPRAGPAILISYISSHLTACQPVRWSGPC